MYDKTIKQENHGGNKMDHLEKAEKLRKHADVSYEEAKKALEESDWDILDALILLESQGKVKSEPAGEYESPHEDPTRESGTGTVFSPNWAGPSSIL